MHRMKIGLAAAGMLLVVTLAFYASVTKALGRMAVAEAEQSLTRAERAFGEIGRLRAAEAAVAALDIARRPTMVAIFANTDEGKTRDAAFAECGEVNRLLDKEGHKAAIVAVLNADGKVVARDLDINAMAGVDLKAQHPAVAIALRGRPVKDVWMFDKGMNEVALAPISRADGAIVGAVLVGHPLSANRAQDTRDELGVEIGFFHVPAPRTAGEKPAGAMDVSSFGSPEDPKREDVTKTQALGAIAFGTDQLGSQALETRRPSPSVHATIEGREYLTLAAPLLGSFDDRRTGVVLASSISDAADRLQGLPLKVLALGLLSILVALGAAVLTAKRFVAPLDKIELGVGEIINGNIDYTFKPVGPDFEGLSNALNVMLARLLGREEPNEDAVEEEEEGASHKWRADQMIIDEGDGAGAQGASVLAQEDESAYYPRLFNEYVAALGSTGKPAEGLSVPAFMAKLRLTEAGLKEKWSCRLVRFQLAMRGNDIVFRAVKLD
jgi:hypothetical protein